MTHLEDNDSRLISGTVLLSRPEDANRSYGSLSGETPPTSDGYVQITLDNGTYAAAFAHGLSLRLEERIARTLADALLGTCTRLAHLRLLHRSNKLDPSAVRRGARWQPSTTPVPDNIRSLQLLFLPEPAEAPSVLLSGTSATLAYLCDDGCRMELALDGVRSVRCCKGDSPSRVGKVDRAANDIDDLETFVFSFPTGGYEIVARMFSAKILDHK